MKTSLLYVAEVQAKTAFSCENEAKSTSKFHLTRSQAHKKRKFQTGGTMSVLVMMVFATFDSQAI